MLSVPYQSQLHPRWCGPAVLAMVLAYYGFTDSQSDIAAKVMKGDYSYIDELSKYAAGKGLEAFRIYRLEEKAAITKLSELVRNQIPPIVLQQPAPEINDSHFRVVLNVEPTAIVAHDPKFGPLQRYEQSIFLRLWKAGGKIQDPTTILIIQRPRKESGIDSCPYCGFSPHSKVFTCYDCGNKFTFSQGFPTECPHCQSIWKTITCYSCGKSWDYFKPKGR